MQSLQSFVGLLVVPSLGGFSEEAGFIHEVVSLGSQITLELGGDFGGFGDGTSGLLDRFGGFFQLGRDARGCPGARGYLVTQEGARKLLEGLCAGPISQPVDESIREVAGTSHRLPSGPLHDAAEVARAGVPTVMLFVQSLRGLSHTPLEDSKTEHLELSVQALDRLASKAIDRVAAAA